MIYIEIGEIATAWSYSISISTTPYNDCTGLTSSTWHDNVSWANIVSQKSYVAPSSN